MPTINEMLIKKIDELGTAASKDVETILNNPMKAGIFYNAFQDKLQQIIADMRVTLGEKETNEILKIYIKLNEEIDAFAQRVFTN